MQLLNNPASFCFPAQDPWPFNDDKGNPYSAWVEDCVTELPNCQSISSPLALRTFALPVLISHLRASKSPPLSSQRGE